MAEIASAMLSALLNVFIFTLPLVIYAAVLRLRRHKVERVEIIDNLGLRRAPPHYVALALAFCAVNAVVVGALAYLVGPELVHDSSPLAKVRTLGPTPAGITVAVLYGMIQTGLSEELLFRGLIAGALARRMSLWKANVLQTLVFVVPHGLVVVVAPELWWIALLFPTLGGLVAGWLRIKSGSVVPAWLTHGIGNTSMALSVLLFL